ncbi:MAG: flagellar hook-basal body complex protein FliE [Candidatus Baltobacteraceae bacterium]
MRVELLTPDAPPNPQPAADPSAFAKAVDDVGAVLVRATRAEDGYAAGVGSLQNAVLERARADVALSVTTAAAQRAAQAITAILNMQI